MRQLGLEKSIAFRNRYLGKTLNVLIESKRDKKSKLMVGFSGNYIRVLMPEIEDAEETFRNVLIRRIEEYDTFGTICENNDSLETIGDAAG